MDSPQPDTPAAETETATSRPWEHDPDRPPASPKQAVAVEDETSIEEPGYGHGV